MKLLISLIILFVMLIPLIACDNQSDSVRASPTSDFEARLSVLEERLAILCDKAFGTTIPEYVYLDPSGYQGPVQTWESIKADLGSPLLEALDRLWYQGGTLTQEEIIKLQRIHSKYPLGYRDFNAWVKQGLKQFFENSIQGHDTSSMLVLEEPLDTRFKYLEEKVLGGPYESLLFPQSLEARLKAIEDKLGIKYYPQ